MKNPVYLIILLSLGLVFVSYKWIATSVPERELTDSKSVQSTENVINCIMTRSSVRSYTDRPVSEEQLDTLLRAAMAAPTAGNKQPWRFVVINDSEILNFISDNFESMTMVKKAPLAVVVCGDIDATFDGEGQAYWVQDASAATENLLLAAHSMGLGAVWCGIYPLKDRVEKFSQLLHLPDNIIPLNCIAIGYPEGNAAPKDKWKPENIHYNQWDDNSSQSQQ